MGLLEGNNSGNGEEGEEGMMAWADERERRRTWQENEAQRECLVATAADVVYQSSHNIALNPQSTKRDGDYGPRLRH